MIRPFKFLITSNAFREVSPGETLEILWGDPDSLADLFRILPPLSYDPVITKTMEGTEPCVRIRLKKTTQHQGCTGLSCAADLNLLNCKRREK